MTQPTQVRIGTRASLLARWQADWVSDALANLGAVVELVEITTKGDAQQQGPIAQFGGQGVFTKEIQAALLGGEVDLAVHSLKDLPTDATDGLVLAAVPERERSDDALVSDQFASLEELPNGARVGTGSMRRRAQLKHLRPDLEILDIRGNVDTRIRKLIAGDYDAIILAAAGLRRLGLEKHIRQLLAPPMMLPAAGQGALGIECRADDNATQQLLAKLDHQTSRQAVTAERALLAALRAGCLAPVGAWGRVQTGELLLDAVVADVDGKRCLRASQTGSLADATALGQQVAEKLFAQGAEAIIAQSRQA